MRIRRSIGPYVIAVLPLVAGSCAFYSPVPSQTAKVESIGVPLMKNETAEFGLAEQLTEGVTDGLIEDNAMKVVDPSRAEGVLEATILNYERSAYTFDAEENVSEYLVEITIKASLINRETGAPIWEASSIRARGEFSASETEQDGQRRAIDELIAEILNRTVKSW